MKLRIAVSRASLIFQEKIEMLLAVKAGEMQPPHHALGHKYGYYTFIFRIWEEDFSDEVVL